MSFKVIDRVRQKFNLVIDLVKTQISLCFSHPLLLKIYFCA